MRLSRGTCERRWSLGVTNQSDEEAEIMSKWKL